MNIISIKEQCESFLHECYDACGNLHTYQSQPYTWTFAIEVEDNNWEYLPGDIFPVRVGKKLIEATITEARWSRFKGLFALELEVY